VIRLLAIQRRKHTFAGRHFIGHYNLLSQWLLSISIWRCADNRLTLSYKRLESEP
jgi:hypothetical protein